MSGIANDLEFCRANGFFADIRLYSGKTYLSQVLDLDAAQGWVLIDTPQTFGDNTSSTRIRLGDIESVLRTDTKA